jgi:transposase
LEAAALKPHQSRYWLTPPAADPEEFARRVQTICDTYAAAPTLHARGGHVVSCDEMTGIQALERAAPTLPMGSGHPERREFEYVRHGTRALIASFDVATGTVLPPAIGPTRTEADFAAHVVQVLATDPSPRAEWVFVTDQLDTHKSETLVRLVAAQCGVTDDLGTKGTSGILTSMATRAAFLADPAHRVRFVYTPKHCSWLNQIELWFSILVRKLLRRASFTSVADLSDRILAFVAYFNRTMAKPFKWTYRGRPLHA